MKCRNAMKRIVKNNRHYVCENIQNIYSNSFTDFEEIVCSRKQRV